MGAKGNFLAPDQLTECGGAEEMDDSDHQCSLCGRQQFRIREKPFLLDVFDDVMDLKVVDREFLLEIFQEILHLADGDEDNLDHVVEAIVDLAEGVDILMLGEIFPEHLPAAHVGLDEYLGPRGKAEPAEVQQRDVAADDLPFIFPEPVPDCRDRHPCCLADVA